MIPVLQYFPTVISGKLEEDWLCRFGENVKGCLDPSGGIIRADKALRAIQVISGQTRLLGKYRSDLSRQVS